MKTYAVTFGTDRYQLIIVNAHNKNEVMEIVLKEERFLIREKGLPIDIIEINTKKKGVIYDNLNIR